MTIETEILQIIHDHPLSNRAVILSILANPPSESTFLLLN